jgi:hypothetical protein
VFGWVDPLMAAGEHGNGAGAKAGKMGGGIDAAGEAGDDTESSVAQLARQPFCELYASRRCVARADDGDQRLCENGKFAAHRMQRRRIVDHLQSRQIIRLAEHNEFDAARPKAARAHIVAADEAQPVEPLLLAQSHTVTVHVAPGRPRAQASPSERRTTTGYGRIQPKVRAGLWI